MGGSNGSNRYRVQDCEWERERESESVDNSVMALLVNVNRKLAGCCTAMCECVTQAIAWVSVLEWNRLFERIYRRLLAIYSKFMAVPEKSPTVFPPTTTSANHFEWKRARKPRLCYNQFIQLATIVRSVGIDWWWWWWCWAAREPPLNSWSWKTWVMRRKTALVR